MLGKYSPDKVTMLSDTFRLERHDGRQQPYALWQMHYPTTRGKMSWAGVFKLEYFAATEEEARERMASLRSLKVSLP